MQELSERAVEVSAHAAQMEDDNTQSPSGLGVQGS